MTEDVEAQNAPIAEEEKVTIVIWGFFKAVGSCGCF